MKTALRLMFDCENDLEV